jgi:hydrogenase nickel incorporation protein HypB
MCATCGCSDDQGVRVQSHEHAHSHDHSHEHEAAAGRIVQIEQDVLAKNDHLAEHNRAWFAERGMLAVNLMSSPGSGKTTLLERTIADLSGEHEISVIEGDQETEYDAKRISDAGARAVQINTGAGCHLDADMLAKGLAVLDPPARSIVFIENVGNLVCPALFDLGEGHRAVVMSVTEGASKPLKYPHMFRTADLVLLNKIDLLPYVDFEVDRFLADARTVNPGVEVIEVSATKGDGLPAWYDWLGKHLIR